MLKRLLIFVVFLGMTGCSTSQKNHTEIYNSSYLTRSDVIFNVNNTIYYFNSNSKEWNKYNTVTKSVDTVSVDLSRNSNADRTKVNQDVFPAREGIYILSHSFLKEKEWVVDYIGDALPIPKKVGISGVESLLNQEGFTHMTKDSSNEKWNPYCDIMVCDLLENVFKNTVYIYNGFLYRAENTNLLQYNISNGKLQSVLPLQLNQNKQVLSFIGSKIYYLDEIYNITVYDTIKRSHNILLEKADDFYITKDAIIYRSLNDGYLYEYSLDSHKNSLILDFPISNFSKKKDSYVYVDDNSKLFIKYSIEDEAILIDDSVYAFVLNDNKLYYVISSGEILEFDVQ